MWTKIKDVILSMFICKPEIASVDCCLCCHEASKQDILDIPPLIEMSSTCINAETPIPLWFVILRTLLTIGMIFMILLNFGWYAQDGNQWYWFIYFTQWNFVVATISMITKTISTHTIYHLLKRGTSFDNANSQNALYTSMLKPNTRLWKLHIVQDIFLQTSIPGESLVVLKLNIIYIYINISTVN